MPTINDSAVGTGKNVNKAEVLCDRDRAMLTAFSERALARITGRSLNALLLPLVTEYMNANVTKEVEKDRIIIEHAVNAFKAGTSPWTTWQWTIFLN